MAQVATAREALGKCEALAPRKTVESLDDLEPPIVRVGSRGVRLGSPFSEVGNDDEPSKESVLAATKFDCADRPCRRIVAPNLEDIT